MAQARLKGSGIISYDEEDFNSGNKVDYIVNNKTAADTEGEPIKGTFAFTGTGTSGQVAKGKTFYDKNSVYQIRTGSLTFESASATKASDVEKGQLFYNSSNVYTPSTGSLEFTGTAKSSDVLSGVSFHGNALHSVSNGGVTILTDASKDTTTAMVENTKTFYGGSVTSKKTGTLAFSGNAKTSEVIKGKTYYDTDLHTLRTGTIDWATNKGNAGTGDVEKNKTFITTKTAAQFATASAGGLTGTLAFSGNANESDVENKITFYKDDLHTIKTGSMTLAGNAAASDVIKGKTYQAGIRTVSTGTLELSGTAQPSDVKKDKIFWTAPGVSGKGTLSLAGTAVAAQVLTGKTFYNTSYTIVNGAMPDRGNVSSNLYTGGSYTIPAGYHRGGGKVYEYTAKEQTTIAAASSPATAAKIWSGRTAWVNGTYVSGSGKASNINAVNVANSITTYSDSHGNNYTIQWKFPSNSFYTGVCILKSQGNNPAQVSASSNPSSDSYKIFMGVGTNVSANQRKTTYYSNPNYKSTTTHFALYPYVVVNGTTYWYTGSGTTPVPTLFSIKEAGTCCVGDSCEACDHSSCCEGACGF